MSQTIVAKVQTAEISIAREPALITCIGLSSFAALLLELCLTRLFSVVLFYHYAFLAISVSLLGLGAGGVFAHILRHRLREWPVEKLAPVVSFFWCIATLLALKVILQVPVRLQLDFTNFGRLTLLYSFAAVPFFLSGVLFSTVFARYPSSISKFYAADLCGGSLACLATVPLLNQVGAPNTILVGAVVMAGAGALWARSKHLRGLGFALAVCLSLLIPLNASRNFLDIVYAKGLYRDPAWVEYARWNAISRIEVDRHYDGSKWIVIDADASTAIMNTDPRHWNETAWSKTLLNSAPSLSNVLRPHAHFAIIGPGGGVDVLRALAAGSPKVTGIEINPIIVNDVMRGRYAEYAQHLYELPQVDMHVSDGRSFIRNTREHYDVIQMTLVDTWASTAAGAFALSENNLYTVDAFREYLEHLKPDGMIAITRWEFREPREALRVLSVAIEAMHQLGIANPARNFILVSDGALNEDGRPVLLLGKRSEFTADEQERARNHVASHPNLVMQYLPSSPGDNAFSRLIASNDPKKFARDYKFDVTPVTDNAPFFFFTLKIGQLLRQGVYHGIDWKVNLGVLVLGIVLLLSLVAVLVFLFVPLLLRTQGQLGSVLPLTYFLAIGLGYILVEIAFIQRFVLFLGHPTYALTVVVFLMLLSSGIGSMLSRRWLSRHRAGRLALTAIVAVLFGYVFLLPVLLPALVGVSFVVKLAISALLLVPLGLFMGVPFPTGLSALGAAPRVGLPDEQQSRENSIEWAWALNAAASVLGSVLAITIGIRFGLSVTLATGAVAYALAAMLCPSFGRGDTPNTRLI
jgi:hypothetical protein